MRFSQLCFGIVCLLVHIKYGVRAVHVLGNPVEQFNIVLREQPEDHLAVVFFTADWCGPCQTIGPYFEELSQKPENADVFFAKVDVDDAEDISTFCRVSCLPTFVFYKNAQEIDRFCGANPTTLRDKINEHR